MDIDIDTALKIAKESGFDTVKKHIDGILTAQFGYLPLSSSTSAVRLNPFEVRARCCTYGHDRQFDCVES